MSYTIKQYRGVILITYGRNVTSSPREEVYTTEEKLMMLCGRY